MAKRWIDVTVRVFLSIVVSRSTAVLNNACRAATSEDRGIFQRPMRKVLTLFAMLISCLPAMATTTYVSQNGGVFSGGTACNGQTTISIATFNGNTYSAGAQIYFCGAITTAVTERGSGASGNPITITFDTGARVSLPYCNSQCFSTGSNNYITINGGTPCGPGTSCTTTEAANPTGYPSGITGIIEATDSGSSLDHQPSSGQLLIGSGTNIIIENLILRNEYVRTVSSDDVPNNTLSDAVAWYNSYLSVHDSTIHDVCTGLMNMASPVSYISFYDNNVWNANWGYGHGSGGTGLQEYIYIYNNHFGSPLNWDDPVNNPYHHNRIMMYQNGTPSSSDAYEYVYIYNNLMDGNMGCCSTSDVFFDVGPFINTYLFNNITTNVGQAYHVDNDYFTLGGGTLDTIWLYNNTSLGAGGSTETGGCIGFMGTTITLQNNIAADCNTLIPASESTTLTASNNLYGAGGAGGGGGGWIWQWNSTNCTTLSCWQSATSTDTTGTAYYASFSSLKVNSDGTLQAGSPAISGGANLYGVCSGQPNPGLGALCYDMAGNARPSSGAWDLGAYNSSDPGPLPPTGLVATAH